MFTKKISEKFEDKMWGGVVEISITIKKLSHMDMERDSKRTMELLKDVDKKDRGTFYKACEDNDMAGILCNINDPDKLADLLINVKENIRKCIHDMSFKEIQGEEITELSGPDKIEEIFSKLDNVHIKWVSDICKKFNPELFGDKGKKKDKN